MDATFRDTESVSPALLCWAEMKESGGHIENKRGMEADEWMRYVQARIGGNLPAETTSKWVAANSSTTEPGRVKQAMPHPTNAYAVVFFNPHGDRRR